MYIIIIMMISSHTRMDVGIEYSLSERKSRKRRVNPAQRQQQAKNWV
jgi:hypothetical protein